MTALPNPAPQYLMHLTTDELRVLLGDILSGTADENLTTAEAAATLKFSENTVLRWAASGTLPAWRIGNEWRFSRNQLMAAQHAAAGNLSLSDEEIRALLEAAGALEYNLPGLSGAVRKLRAAGK